MYHFRSSSYSAASRRSSPPPCRSAIAIAVSSSLTSGGDEVPECPRVVCVDFRLHTRTAAQGVDWGRHLHMLLFIFGTRTRTRTSAPAPGPMTASSSCFAAMSASATRMRSSSVPAHRRPTPKRVRLTLRSRPPQGGLCALGSQSPPPSRPKPVLAADVATPDTISRRFEALQVDLHDQCWKVWHAAAQLAPRPPAATVSREYRG